MKQLIILSLFSIGAITTHAQFYQTAKIEFEKKMYFHAYMKSVDEEWFEMAKEHSPKEMITYHDFIGNAEKSIYKPGKDGPNTGRNFFSLAKENVVYNDYVNKTTISQKPVFEETFLMQDSLSKIKWRVLADTRTIAGFECRKAVGILDDTVGVIAFYTDELMMSGGPEGITGLPGMILGLSVPRLNTTWLATKVEVIDVNTNAIVPATKGKKVNRVEMMHSLDKVLREWGKWGSKMIVNFEI